VRPVVDCTEPVLLLVAVAGVADSLWVPAEIDVLELGYLREDLLVQETVVVRASGLDGTTAPPAAAFSGGARYALQGARSPRSSGRSRHLHVGVNWASVGLVVQLMVLWISRVALTAG